MSQPDSSNRFDAVVAGRARLIDAYQLPTAGTLDEAAERALGCIIQQGNSAIHELGAAILLEIKEDLDLGDLAPSGTESVLNLFKIVIAEELVKQAPRGVDATGFGAAVADAIHRGILDLVEDADLSLQVPAEEWLREKLPKRQLANSLAVPLRDRLSLWQAVSRREEAINRLVATHVRLAQPIARRAMRQKYEYGDLMNEAVLILRRAAERFNPASGNRFSSYVMVALGRELRRKSPSDIGVKRCTRSQINEVNRMERALMQERGGSVTADEVYEQLACPDATRIAIEKVRRLLAASRRAYADGQASALDLVEAEMPEPCHEVEKTETGRQLRAALSVLSRMERMVVVGHCIRGQSFRAMAKQYKKSPHTLSEMYNGALDKLARRLIPSRPSHKPR